MVEAFVREGVRVVVADLHPPPRGKGDVCYVKCDVTCPPGHLLPSLLRARHVVTDRRACLISAGRAW